MRIIHLTLVAALLTSPLLAQQPNDAPRTIDVTSEGSSSTEADVAIITVSCTNYGATEQIAYEENARRGNRLLDALVKAGIQKSALETSSVSVTTTEIPNYWTPEQKKERQHEAEQSLTIRVMTKNSSAVVDLAMHSGATVLKSVKWDLSDPNVADAKANEAALANARVVAEQLAKGLGVKVGKIVKISNTAERERFVEQFWLRREDVRYLIDAHTEPVTLLPEKITRSATVHVVFAMD